MPKNQAAPWLLPTVALLAGILGTDAVWVALAVALAQWLIVATQMGSALGLQPVDSALRLGPALALQFMRLSLGRAELAWLLASLPVAAFLALPSRRERAASA